MVAKTQFKRLIRQRVPNLWDLLSNSERYYIRQMQQEVVTARNSGLSSFTGALVKNIVRF